MKKESIAVAYPTIPIIFLGGIHKDRTPLYDTMGLAVSNINETTRTETCVKVADSSKKFKINFHLNGEKISGKRGQQIIDAIENFMTKNSITKSITITSNNYDIYSGSSDSGLAALFTALNDFFELNYSKDKLLEFAAKGSESVGRSLYGGLTITKVNKKPISVMQLASEFTLANVHLFAVPFFYDVRISADEIHAGIVSNPKFIERVKKIPEWISKIITALNELDFIKVFELAEENIRNAHELLEGVGIIVRKPEMMQLCSDIEQVRKNNIPAYFLIGGGNLVTIATTDKYVNDLASFLVKKNWKYYNYKVASAPKIIRKK